MYAIRSYYEIFAEFWFYSCYKNLLHIFLWKICPSRHQLAIQMKFFQRSVLTLWTDILNCLITLSTFWLCWELRATSSTKRVWHFEPPHGKLRLPILHLLIVSSENLSNEFFADFRDSFSWEIGCCFEFFFNPFHLFLFYCHPLAFWFFFCKSKWQLQYSICVFCFCRIFIYLVF